MNKEKERRSYLSKSLAIGELSREICKGCKTQHKCDNNDGFCIMSDVVAEYLVDKGYGNVKQAVKEVADYLTEYARACQASGYDGIGAQDIQDKFKEFYKE